MKLSSETCLWLLVGGSGYFGAYFRKTLLEFGAEYIISTFCNTKPAAAQSGVKWQKLDLTNREDLVELRKELESFHGAIKVVVLAATHHPDKVRSNFRDAARVNYVGLVELLNVLPNNAQVTYVSTDAVYGEGRQKKFFNELDELLPINAYGRQKIVCEQIVLSYGHCVVRCSFLIGPSLIERPHFFDQIADSLKRGEKLAMLSDQYRSAIDFDQAASLIVQLMMRYPHGEFGVVNVGADMAMSKFDVALNIARKYELSTNALEKVMLSESSLFAERRAQEILLDNTKLKRLLCLPHITCKF